MTQTRGMISKLALLSLCAPCIAANEESRDAEESHDAYVIVTRAVIAVLPEPMHTFFMERADAVEEAAVRAALPAGTVDATGTDSSGHYVMLDAIAVDDLRGFPRDRTAAMQRFQQSGVHDGGELPWIILKRHSALVLAFREGVTDRIIAETGTLLHYVTDGTLPFNTVADRDGRNTRSLRWSTEEAGAVGARHRTVRHRVQVEFIRRHRERLAFEVRLFPKRYRVVEDEAVFGMLLAAHAAAPELVRIDADIIADLKIADASAFVAIADTYYEELAARAGSIVETRLEEGALLGAGLIGAAWAQAGSPALDTPGAGSAESTTPLGTDQPPAVLRYVASRNSTVYHKAACPHAARIKPANIVTYDTLEAVKQTGRNPCKSCFRPRPQP